ncbi:MAG: hypothetical protein ACREYB_10750 [Casimicrobiaceae bacterium]
MLIDAERSMSLVTDLQEKIQAAVRIVSREMVVFERLADAAAPLFQGSKPGIPQMSRR